jgi:hypothetical protein
MRRLVATPSRWRNANSKNMLHLDPNAVPAFRRPTEVR